MTINRCILMFNIQTDSTTEIVTELFNACEIYISNQVEHLYKKTIQLKNLPDEYSSLIICGYRYYRPEDKIPTRDKLRKIQYLSLDASLNEEGNKLNDFVDQAKKDARFLQMWLSTVIKKDDLIQTKRLMPPALARLSENLKVIDVEYQIPETKTELWHQVEEKINFYLGLKLVL